MKYFSMFSGIGGFEYGIGTQAKCVGYSEIDDTAISVYKRHYPEHEGFGDATTINPRKLPDFGLLMGGFPCQSFSVAGKRAGFDDTRGTLFFDVARILEHKRPELVVLENVKGLLTHDNGVTFQRILGVLTDLGYHVQWQVLNSKDFGVPQNRERVYIVGHLRGQPRPKVFPLSGTESAATQNFIGGLGATRKNMENQKELSRAYSQPQRVFDSVGISPTISAQESSGRYNILEGGRIRRLTPKECERLQGFPDNWTKYSADGKEISDSQRYKMCGNAVTTNVVNAVFSRLLAVGVSSKEGQP